MRTLIYYSIRVGLLSLIVILGLISYAPDTLNFFGKWSNAHRKADYISESTGNNTATMSPSRLRDSEVMLSAINNELSTVRYVFGKNKFRPYNQANWWPSIHAAAIEARKSDVLKHLLSQGYECDYANSKQGVTAFRAAVAAPDYIYLELLLSANCDTTPAQFRPSLEALIKRSRYPERLQLLN